MKSRYSFEDRGTDGHKDWIDFGMCLLLYIIIGVSHLSESVDCHLPAEAEN